MMAFRRLNEYLDEQKSALSLFCRTFSIKTRRVKLSWAAFFLKTEDQKFSENLKTITFAVLIESQFDQNSVRLECKYFSNFARFFSLWNSAETLLHSKPLIYLNKQP